MTGMWQRLFGREPSPPLQPANDRPTVVEDIRERIRSDVAAGFDDPADMLRNVVDTVSDQVSEEEAERLARPILHEELAAHAAVQRDWPATTDCDRLDAAFAALERGGIVARQHFTCCGTCGSAEIWDEIASFEAQGGRAYGYAFYHMQDTDSAVEGYGLYLNYGACEDGEEPAIATGRAIVAELERQGLKTDWDGTWEKRIGVALDWKRRRAG